jgi:hypothetical protein
MGSCLQPAAAGRDPVGPQDPLSTGPDEPYGLEVTSDDGFIDELCPAGSTGSWPAEPRGQITSLLVRRLNASQPGSTGSQKVATR